MTSQESAQLLHNAHAIAGSLSAIADQLARLADLTQQRLSLDKTTAEGLYPVAGRP